MIAFSTATAALQRATALLDRSAARIADARATGDVAADLVNMTIAREDYRANVAVVNAASNMMGALLNILT